MKVLILSCSTGGGHNSCAKYIKEELESNNIDCHFIDYYDVVSDKGKEISSKIYLDSLKFDGKLFKGIYKMGELYSKTKLTSPVYLANKIHKKDLLKYIEYNKYDLVIATHVFPAMALTAINAKSKKINFIFVATDYECAPFTQEITPDYLITQKGLKDNFVKKGVNKPVIKEFGIPVSSKFIKDAKNIRKDLGVKEEKIVLMMLGSMGFGKVIKAVNSILAIDNIKLVVICGSNKALYETLNNINNNKLIVKGFINNINDYIYSADVVVSKPGGLSSTEIASIGKPLIHIFPIPGVETYNVNYFNSNDMSISCDNINKLVIVLMC